LASLQVEPEVDEDEKAVRARKAEAQKAKLEGNAAYSARRFDEAITHYNRALELDDSDISFLTNR
jgi:stress-induced-phosphoprotein 1